MPGILKEENGVYEFDCRNAVWESGEMHDVYNECKLSQFLCDADFVIETSDILLLVEYKNANIEKAREHAKPDNTSAPSSKELCKKIANKYYDSLHYIHLLGKNKPIHYIFVSEYPKGDSVSRKSLRNMLKDLLPFGLQERIGAGVKLIESIDVVSIDEWNNHKVYGQFPIKPVEKQET